MHTTRNILYVLASLCLAYEIHSSRGQMYSYKRLCESLSKKATRQRLKLCERSEDKLLVVRRLRRDVNTTQQTSQTSTQAIETSTSTTTTKRPLSSYECTTQRKSSKGFVPNSDGLDLTVKCAKDGNWWSAAITWKIPKIEPGRHDCVGYLVTWDTPSGHYCDYINVKNVTSYFMDSSKGWAEFSDGDNRLWIAVFPLPQTRKNREVSFRKFLPSQCSEPTTSPPLLTTLMMTSRATTNDPGQSALEPNRTNGTSYINTATTTNERTTLRLTSTTSGKNRGKNPKDKSGDSDATTTLRLTSTPGKNRGKNPTDKSGDPDGPVVNKLVFSIVIASIAVVILMILFALYKKRNSTNNYSMSENIGKNNNTLLQGASHYISYNAYNKNEAMDIARWLQQNNVKVIIDEFSVIKINQRAWSEQQLLAAEKIIMIITPRYLEICTLHQSTSNKEKKFGSYNDELTYNEISLIKNKLVEKNPDKFIAILNETKEKDLPHWMSQLNCYKYKNGKLDEEILKMLKPFHISE